MRPMCRCEAPLHGCRLVVLTGGPGAGKTAVLEIIRKSFCAHVAVLPEAATIVFGGGFPRTQVDGGRRAAQRAIYHVQRELERVALEGGQAAVALCDRGTVDGLAYWPGTPSSYWEEVGTSQEAELRRYAAVIHLRTPSAERGYNHVNPVRLESAQEAAILDERIALAWDGHPRRFFVESAGEFLDKAAQAVALVRQEVPPCCRAHPVPELDRRR